jgi:hypothetical protein
MCEISMMRKEILMRLSRMMLLTSAGHRLKKELRRHATGKDIVPIPKVTDQSQEG